MSEMTDTAIADCPTCHGPRDESALFPGQPYCDRCDRPTSPAPEQADMAAERRRAGRRVRPFRHYAGGFRR